MKKLIFLLVLCLVASSANATFQLFRDNYNVNLISNGAAEANASWRRMAAGEPVYIPSQTDAYRQGGVYTNVSYSEVETLWYGVQAGSSDGDLPPELEPPNRGTKAGNGFFPGNPGEGAENAIQYYNQLGSRQNVSPDVAFNTTDLSVSLDVHVPYSTATGGSCWMWVGIAPTKNNDGALQGTGVILTEDNQWFVVNNGVGNILAQGVGNFASSLVGATDLQMVPVVLDLIGGDLTVVVNGVPLVTDEPLVVSLGASTYVTHGIYGTGNAGDPLVDKFFFADNLEVWGVPEPATIALLGLGGLALLRKKS
jgi:hypothetical protein